MARSKPLEEGAWYVVDLATKKPVGGAFKTEAGAWSKAEHLGSCSAIAEAEGRLRGPRRTFGVAQAKRREG